MPRRKLRLVIWSYVVAYCVATYIMGGFMPVYMADRANGTIKFEPECAAYVHDVFGNKSFVPTFHEFVEISDTVNRCNAQAIASRKK